MSALGRDYVALMCCMCMSMKSKRSSIVNSLTVVPCLLTKAVVSSSTWRVGVTVLHGEMCTGWSNVKV